MQGIEPTQKTGCELIRTKAKKWWDALLTAVRCALRTLHSEVQVSSEDPNLE
ncbi:hypothetical protein E5S67_05632 [Microcoleus sp. IPMA8]|uniref:Uncharacterized protein n=1 Tax=Microcoleus asticus IPMA8 TaxID=2563858 RepID=A0ABX2D5L0_9CYAN|nr:hypothetical protein [Microcoleus asticus IPMA8]